MRSNDTQSGDREPPEVPMSRRRLLQTAGLAGTVGLAGCISVSDDGGGDDGSTDGSGDDGSTDDGSGDDGSTDDGSSDDGGTTDDDGGSELEGETVTFGVLSPTSGPFAPLGGPQRQGAQTAVEYVNNSDEFDFEIEATYKDTETDPSVGRRRAQRAVEQDGAQFLAGEANSSVALAISSYAANAEVMYASGGAGMQLTEEECNEYTFRNETNAAQQASGVAQWILNEGFSRVWIHTADYAYGNSAMAEIERALEGEDVEIVGRTTPSLGTSNFQPFISQIADSDAEVLAIPLTGGDLIDFIGQADGAGLKGEVDIIGTANFAGFVRGALGPAVAGTFSAALYSPGLEVGDNQQFVSQYQEMHDGLPDSFARVGYEAVRMQARGIQAAGTTDPSEVKDVLPGLEMETVLGTTSFRECDHQSPNPVWPSEIVLPSEGAEMTELNILEEISPENTTPPCSGNCDL